MGPDSPHQVTSQKTISTDDAFGLLKAHTLFRVNAKLRSVHLSIQCPVAIQKVRAFLGVEVGVPFFFGTSN
jgi:hypothetical protein